jgi:hypothetical protein
LVHRARNTHVPIEIEALGTGPREPTSVSDNVYFARAHNPTRAHGLARSQP